MTKTDELRALDQLTARLRCRFPEAPPEGIRALVERAHHQYDGSPIRDFIPVLVEGEVVEHFRVPASRRARAS
jgi:hypothetical protein